MYSCVQPALYIVSFCMYFDFSWEFRVLIKHPLTLDFGV